MTNKVCTFQHGVFSGLEIELCDECASRDDHGWGLIGRVQHGSHAGECRGVRHPGMSRAERAEARKLVEDTIAGYAR
jgi:hypothetical protein